MTSAKKMSMTEKAEAEAAKHRQTPAKERARIEEIDRLLTLSRTN